MTGTATRPRPQAPLPSELCRNIHLQMVRARALEERLLTLCQSGEGHFWIGGPGEEAFNVCLGLRVNKGCGPGFDYLHLHYRSFATLLAMGMAPADAVRSMFMTATDPHSRGRNLCGHVCRREWNVPPVSSVIGVQFARAPGTALVQRRSGGDGVTVAVGGDAGTAAGDFAACLAAAARPGRELPLLIVVTNNGYGISTPTRTQLACRSAADRARWYGIPAEVVDGNDPVASWAALGRAFGHCRRDRRPYLLEARVSRLHGHSSSSGGRRDPDEPDCLALFEGRLRKAGLLTEAAAAAIHTAARAEVERAVEQVRGEPGPTADDVYRDTYAPSPVDAVYPDDYTGLPR